MSMLTKIEPSSISGILQAPASKSSMQRACAAALLLRGHTIIRNPGHSNDDKAAIEVIKGLGAAVTSSGDGSLLVNSTLSKSQLASREVNCGESGLGIRMFAPLIALSSDPIKVNGMGSLLNRPMDFFDEIFPQLGIRVVSNKGKLPLEIQGPLLPRDITIDGSLSSQFLTGLLFAYAAAGAKDVTITVNDLKSKPYIDLTLQVMDHFGWKVGNDNYERFVFGEGQGNAAGAGPVQKPASVDYTVEGDWSGGAFLLVAGAVAGKITVRGLSKLSTQADKAILQALQDAGAAIAFYADKGTDVIEIGPGSRSDASGSGSGIVGSDATALKPFRFDATDCPDLFPPLVALAAYCKGTSLITGVSRLAHKESNRGLTLQDEFGKMGVRIELEGDLMRVHGGGGVRGALVHSRHDHRIAMACAVAALKAEGATTIEDADAINKSYPDFYSHLEKLGAAVQITQVTAANQ